MASVRDDVLRERLREANPWWRAVAGGGDAREWAKADRMLRGREPFDLGYRTAILDDVAHGVVDDKLIVLRGPRRVGKSVALKDVALSICTRSDIDPRQLIYFAGDGMSRQDLHRAIKLARDLTRPIDPAPRVWLLDEITGIPNWTVELKNLRDNTLLGEDTVVCTGSSWDGSSNVERDLFAGRSGVSVTNRSRTLHPMSFRNVVAITDRDISMPEVVHPWELQASYVGSVVTSLNPFIDEFDLAWQSYLTSGGFPRAVAEQHRDGMVSDTFLHDIAAWLHRDVDPSAAADSVSNLLCAIEQHASSPLSRNSLSEELGYPNPAAFDKRLHRLVHAFAALWCHQVDGDGERITGSQSKLYLSDPLLAWVGPRLRSGLPSPDFTRLTEMALATSLARAVDRLQPGRWEDGTAIGYLRTGAGNEIDLSPMPVPSSAGREYTVPIEAKWVATGWRSEAKTIEGKFERGILATRAILNTDNLSWALPAPLLALLLE